MRFLSILLALSLLVACGPGDEKCKPLCEGLQCGDDGCGGTCGTCGADSVCLDGSCMLCTPDCLGKMCGPDGCGGQCGECAEGQVCDALSYLCIEKPTECQPVCATQGYQCGPDGCGGECGECEEGTLCKPDTHSCKGQCTPECTDKQCGPDGCGGVCGECGESESCDNGVCILDSVLPEDDFVALYGYQGRIPGVNNNEHDLYLVNPDRTNPLVAGTFGAQPLTTFSLAGATDCQTILEEDAEGNPTKYGPCSCNFGCVVDRALKWIAISLKKPSATGFTFQIGRFDTQLHVAMVKGVFLKDIVDFKFAGNYLYYTKQFACDGAHCQYMIYRVQLEPVGQTEELFVFPPDSDPDWPKHSNYKGHFKVSADGQMLVLLGTTIRSVRYYLWKAGNLHELDYVCNQVVNGECIGAGSEYNDTDPVAISPDNSRVAAFTVAERDLRLRLYDTSTLQQKYLNLFTVPTGTYMAEICKMLPDIDWGFQKVVGDPHFSPDGSSLYFITYSACNLISADSKPHTNLVMMGLSAVGDGTAFEQSDFINITKNPKSDGPENIVIEDFDISPSGKTLQFVGSPMFNFQGDPADPFLEPLTPDSERARKDREIWLIGAGGQGRTQLTNDKKYEAKNPMALDSSVTSYYNGGGQGG